MPWHPTLRDLRTVLATLYPTVDDARRVVVDAGLDPLRIAFDAKPINNWQQILEEALRSNQVAELLNIARSEYAENLDLVHATQAYLATHNNNSKSVFKTIEPPKPMQPPESRGFIGRAQELAYFATCLATDRVAFIAGMPGVGKTALAAKLARQVAKQPDRIFWHQFHEGEGIETIIWQFAGMLYHHGQTTLWTILDSSRQSGGHPPPAEVLLDYLIQLLTGQDYVLCLDDFHHAEDDPLVDKAVERLQRILPTGSLKLVVTSQRVPALFKSPSFAPIGGLSLSDSSQLLVARKIELSAELTSELYRRTDGNAELLSLAIQALARSRHPEQVVERLVDEDDIEIFLLKAVDEGLNDKQKLVMSGVATLLGHPGSRNAIEATLASGNLKRNLRDLANRFLLREQDGRFGQEYLTYTIMQAFYYELLGQSERQTMHRRAGEYYEHEEPDPLRAALHYLHAGDPGRAVEISAQHVRSMLGQGQARMLKQLLAEIDLTQLSLEMRAQASIVLGELTVFLGETASAKAHFVEAVRLLESTPNQPTMHQLIARASLGMSTTLEYEDPNSAWTWINRGLAAADELDPMLRAGLLNRLGSIHIGRSKYSIAVGSLEQALVLIPPQPPNPLRASILINLNVAYSAQGNLIASSACAEEALVLAQVLNDFYALLTIRSNLALDRERGGEWLIAAADYAEALQLAEQLGVVAEQVRIHNLLGTLHLRQGRNVAAEEHFNKAIVQARETDLKEHLAQTLPAWAKLLIRQQCWAEAEAMLYEAKQLAFIHEWEYVLPETYVGLALLNLGQGQLDTALQCAEESITVAHRLGSQFDEGQALRVKGQISMALNRINQALDAFQQSMLLLENSDKVAAMRVSAQYGNALITAGQFEAGNALLEKVRATRQALRFTEDNDDNF